MCPRLQGDISCTIINPIIQRRKVNFDFDFDFEKVSSSPKVTELVSSTA